MGGPEHDLSPAAQPAVWPSTLTTQGLWGRAGDDTPRSAGVAGGLGGPGVQAGLFREGVSGQEVGKTPPHTVSRQALLPFWTPPFGVSHLPSLGGQGNGGRMLGDLG